MTPASSSEPTRLRDCRRRARRLLRRRNRSHRSDAQEFTSLIGEYGWDHDVLFVREKDGQLNALIEWFFEYPLERVSRDVSSLSEVWPLRWPRDCVSARRQRNGDFSSRGQRSTSSDATCRATMIVSTRRLLPSARRPSCEKKRWLRRRRKRRDRFSRSISWSSAVLIQRSNMTFAMRR